MFALVTIIASLCDGYTCVTASLVWRLHLCDGYTCVTASLVWRLHLCDGYTCVTASLVWRLHLCDGYTCVTATLVWRLHLCDGYTCVTASLVWRLHLCDGYTCVTATLVWRLHLCDGYTCVTATLVWQLHLCDLQQSAVSSSSLPLTHMCAIHALIAAYLNLISQSTDLIDLRQYIQQVCHTHWSDAFLSQLSHTLSLLLSFLSLSCTNLSLIFVFFIFVPLSPFSQFPLCFSLSPSLATTLRLYLCLFGSLHYFCVYV